MLAKHKNKFDQVDPVYHIDALLKHTMPAAKKKSLSTEVENNVGLRLATQGSAAPQPTSAQPNILLVFFRYQPKIVHKDAALVCQAEISSSCDVDEVLQQNHIGICLKNPLDTFDRRPDM